MPIIPLTGVANPLPKLLWKGQWMHLGESPWSIFKKVQLVNSTNEEVLLRYLGIRSVKEKQSLTGLRNTGELWTLTDYDNSILEQNNLLYMKTTHLQNLECLNRIMPSQADNTWIKKDLQFCPSCLSQGFHSLIHQIRWLNTCLIHSVPLLNYCESCGRTYTFHIYDECMPHPFRCICGYSYLKASKFTEWRDIFSKPISYDISQMIVSDNSLSKSYYSITDHSYSHYKDPLYMYLSFKKGKPIEYAYKKTSYSLNLREGTVVNSSGSQYLRALLVQQRAVFKSIARHIRKTYLKSHRSCLHQMKHGVKREGVCYFAMAYLYWRKEIEGDVNYFEVDRGKRRVANGNHKSTFYSLVHELHLKELLEWMTETIWKKKNSFDELFNKPLIEQSNLYSWGLSRIYPLMVWNHFYNCLEAIAELVRRYGHINVQELPMKRHDQIPFFLFTFDHDTNDLIYQEHLIGIKLPKTLYCSIIDVEN